MNGPNRLSLERTAEARRYDAMDWPGSGSFQPPHLNALFSKMLEKSDPSVEAQPIQPELPFESQE